MALRGVGEGGGKTLRVVVVVEEEEEEEVSQLQRPQYHPHF